jgi:excisionase family DNA binding protein
MKLLTISEVAQVLGVRPARAYELARTGVLPAVHLRRQIRVSDQALREWVAAGWQRLSETAVEAAARSGSSV